MRFVVLALIGVLMGSPVAAQPTGSGDRGAVQHGAQPNADEVRPGNRDGDMPSASAGDLVRNPARRILGLPVTAVLGIAAMLLGLVVVAAVMPRARRRRAQGGGTSPPR